MILSPRIKYSVPVLSAVALLLTASAVQAQTGPPAQLGIGVVYLTAPGNSTTGPVVPCFTGDAAPARYLNFVGRNFNAGEYAPTVLIDLGVGSYSGWYNLIPVDLTPQTLAGGPYYLPIDCSKFNVLTIHRLMISTGNGQPYNDDVSFDFGVLGGAGAPGATGPTGPVGPACEAGANGAT